MKKVANVPGFEYHTKCKGLKLNHLFFANDVLLFCKGAYQSVFLMLRGLWYFSRASGLCTNAGKSNIFSSNIDQQSPMNLCDMTGYQKGSLPFKYLEFQSQLKSTLDRKDVSNRASLVAWDLVFRPKKMGGLGMKNGVAALGGTTNLLMTAAGIGGKSARSRTSLRKGMSNKGGWQGMEGIPLKVVTAGE
ncbi:uncharacterized protein LOC142174310 [Nicotiana tabacum]|uniref:Uncharacterized protein LOC142174310 n=1 Tax=Nicotiana tabacum TaxID=4097 RepID=A0AC58TG36_TOBAC